MVNQNKKEEHEGFITNIIHRVEKENSFLFLYGRLKKGPSFCVKKKFSPYFYVEKKDLEKIKEIAPDSLIEDTNLKSFSRKEVAKIVFKNQTDLVETRKRIEEEIKTFEADIKPENRLIIDYDLSGSLKIIGSPIEKKDNMFHFQEPELNKNDWIPSINDLVILSLDIETSMNLEKLYSVSIATNTDEKKVFIVGKQNLKNAVYCSSEQELLDKLQKKINEIDPDVITGWNLIDFDLKILVDFLKKNKQELKITRNKQEAVKLRITDSFMTDSKAECEGRVVLDGIHLLKTSFIKLDDYKLGTAAKKFSKSTKLIGEENKGKEIETAYKENPQKLVNYNLMDSELVLDIIKNSGVLELTILRTKLTGMMLDRVRASIASFDSLYIRHLKEKGFVAPSNKFFSRDEKTTGGFVMDPEPGIYDYVLVCDFKSLYPSIMRTFNIDPLMFVPNCDEQNLIKAPNGACFKREKGILPKILEELWLERELARKRKDQLTRQAIKISMNSMYGVLASPNCRFYSRDMANAITHFGHLLLKKTKELIEQNKYSVIYGDTDSVFVSIKAKNFDEAQITGRKIQNLINDFLKNFIKKEYGTESKIELEFEKTFKKFFLPRTRGSEEGAKKRYAGLLETLKEEKIDFTGLEFVRRDWTELSKNFQLALLDRVFKEKPVEQFIKEFVNELKKGNYDSLLVYRKALRKDVNEYTKTTPPHVKAARLLDKITTNIIDYVITLEGPEPLEKQKNKIDYEHYIDKQIKPLANSVLCFFDTDFDKVISGSEQKTLGNW